jgi:hypothetical protein
MRKMEERWLTGQVDPRLVRARLFETRGFRNLAEWFNESSAEQTAQAAADDP